jgi:putative phosphoesterase
MPSFRLGIITDVHADVHALESALRRMQELHCDAVVCCGDLVDLGLFPEETIEVLQRDGIPCVRGNHDRWAVGHGAAHDPRGHGDDRDATGFDLSPGALSFLAGLPTAWRSVVHGVRVVVWHSRPGDQAGMLGIHPDQLDAIAAEKLLADADADVLVVGHTHVTFEARLEDCRRILNPGALWRNPDALNAPRALILRSGRTYEAEPTDGGRFGVLDVPSLEFTVRDALTGTVVQHRILDLMSALSRW